MDNKYGNWISVSERLPNDGDMRFYMCLVENHIEDAPLMCQFSEESGEFGFYKNIFDPVSLGFVDTEFETINELGYEKVMYWRKLPKPYAYGESEKITNADKIRNMADEELASYIFGVSVGEATCTMCQNDCDLCKQSNDECKDKMLAWLQSEAEEECS